ncbi:MAG: ferrous iron transport protein B [Calditrichaeota bacterium]|nr:ferrous iron transport protein B [Calditrichota bacterium]
MPVTSVIPKTNNIALVGNPNTGKTSVFNALTGLRQKVANYPGVTVEKKTGSFSVNSTTFTVYDLPGLYSLIPKSLDDKISTEIIYNHNNDVELSCIVVVVDAANLSRNLYLFTQILDLQIPVVMALNMIDVADKKGIKIDIEGFKKEFNIPVIPLIASKRSGLAELKNTISDLVTNPDISQQKYMPIPDEITKCIGDFRNFVKNGFCESEVSLTARSLRIISSDHVLQDWIDKIDNTKIDEAQQSLAKARKRLLESNQHWSMLETKLRYQWIDEVLNTYVHTSKTDKQSLSDRIDKILTHKVGGLFIFFIVFAMIFQAIFSWAELPMALIEDGTNWLGQMVTQLIPAGALQDMIVDGAIAGVGSILVFLPQILFLFFFLSILEDTGYMARVAFMLDRVMNSIGLSGRSVIPLLSSFACAVPGIMASRTIQNWRDRLVTIMISPFMSCSARLPVYVLLIGAFIPKGSFLGIVSYSALTLLAMYTLGIVAAILVALVFKKFIVRTMPSSSFVLELPAYHRPNLRYTFLQLLERIKIFVTDAGKIILAMSIVLWFMASYPKSDESDTSNSSQKIEQSYAGKIGKFIEPAIKPLGFDWKIGVGLLTSFAAREVMVSTLATIYNVEGADETSGSLKESLKNDRDPVTGELLYSPLTAISLMVFFVLACQCMATVAIVKRETNSWRWPITMIAYMTGLAYLASLLTFQIGSYLGIGV